jgi:hypothetical protein
VSSIDPHKVDVPNSVTRIFEWYVVWCDSKSKYQRDICLKETGLRGQNMITIPNLNSQHHLRDLYDHLKNTEIFDLIINKIFIRAPCITISSGQFRTNHMFSYPWRSGLVGKSNHIRPSTTLRLVYHTL